MRARCRSVCLRHALITRLCGTRIVLRDVNPHQGHTKCAGDHARKHVRMHAGNHAGKHVRMHANVRTKMHTYVNTEREKAHLDKDMRKGGAGVVSKPLAACAQHAHFCSIFTAQSDR